MPVLTLCHLSLDDGQFVILCMHANAVRNAKEVPQAEAKGKPASEAPMTPSAWKGTQVCQLTAHTCIFIFAFALNAVPAIVKVLPKHQQT